MDLYFLIKNQLFQEPKHEKKLGEAIWLYGYLLSYANVNGGELSFYIGTYCKRLQKDKELVRSQLKLLEFERYITLTQIDESCYKITINKPIKTKNK